MTYGCVIVNSSLSIQRKLRERVSWSSGPKTKSDRMIPACGRFSIEYSNTHSNGHILYDMIAHLQLCPLQYPLKIFVNIRSLSRIWVHDLQLGSHAQSIKQVGTLLSRTIHLGSRLTITRKKITHTINQTIGTVLHGWTIVSTSQKSNLLTFFFSFGLLFPGVDPQSLGS